MTIVVLYSDLKS